MLNYSAAVDYSKIITIEPGKRSGKPCIRSMRITVQDVFEYLAGGMTEEQILVDFLSLPGSTLMLASPLRPTAATSSSYIGQVAARRPRLAGVLRRPAASSVLGSANRASLRCRSS